MFHEYASDTHFLERLVEVVLDMRANGLLDVFHEEVVRGDVVRLVRHLGCLAIQAERRLEEHSLWAGDTGE